MTKTNLRQLEQCKKNRWFKNKCECGRLKGKYNNYCQKCFGKYLDRTVENNIVERLKKPFKTFEEVGKEFKKTRQYVQILFKRHNLIRL